MSYLAFQEIKDDIIEDFQDSLNETNSFIWAGAYTGDDFWDFSKEPNNVNNLLVITTVVLEVSKGNRVFIGTKNLFYETLNSVKEEQLDLELSVADKAELLSMIEEAKEKLSIVEIEYDSRAK